MWLRYFNYGVHPYRRYDAALLTSLSYAGSMSVVACSPDSYTEGHQTSASASLRTDGPEYSGLSVYV